MLDMFSGESTVEYALSLQTLKEKEVNLISAPCLEPLGFFLQQSSETKPVKIYPVLAIGLTLLQLQLSVQPYQMKFYCWSLGYETEQVL